MGISIEQLPIENIEQRLQKLVEDAKKDCAWDKADLNQTAFNNTKMVMKWIGKKQDWLKMRRLMNTVMKKKRRKLFEYYKTEYDLKLDNKEEINLFVDSDEDYVDLEQKQILIKECCLFIDSVLDNLKARAWEIKAFIEYQKFLAGR